MRQHQRVAAGRGLTRHLVQADAESAVGGDRPAQQLGCDVRRDRASGITHFQPRAGAAGEADLDREIIPRPALGERVLQQVIAGTVEQFPRQPGLIADLAIAELDVLAGIAVLLVRFNRARKVPGYRCLAASSSAEKADPVNSMSPAAIPSLRARSFQVETIARVLSTISFARPSLRP